MFDPTKKQGRWGNKDKSLGYRSCIVQLDSGGWERYEQKVTVSPDGVTEYGDWNLVLNHRHWIQENL